MEYVEPVGVVVSPDDLKIPKAREVVRFLESGFDRGAVLLETRRHGATETLIVTLSELEVGQQPKIPVLNEERFALCFSQEDLFAPQVLALRTDFPDAPHINRTTEEIPRSLCLYEEPYEEVKLSWTAGRFVERIRVWIRDTARDALHRDDQPLEPILLAGAPRLILPADLFSAKEDEAPEALIIVRYAETPAGKALVAKRAADTSAAERQHVIAIVCTVIVAAPHVHGRIRHIPKNLSELHELHMAFGRDLILELRTKLAAWNRNDAPLDSKILIISSFPRQRRADAAPEASDVQAFLCPAIRDIGAAIGLWQLHGTSIGALIGGEPDVALLRHAAVAVLNPSFGLSRERAAAANTEKPSFAKIAAVGAGALGSQVVPILVKGGFGTWALIDDDLLLPHNCARHEMGVDAVAYPKAHALAVHCNSMTAEEVAEGLIANVLRPAASAQDLSQTLDEAAAILDFSASVAVARHLAQLPTSARRISAFMSPSGSALVLLSEDVGRTLRLDHLEMQYYRALLRNPSLAGHMRPPAGRVRYARSCRDVSSTVPADLVAMNAAIAARGVRQALAEEGAGISIWSADADRNVSLTRVTTEHVSQRTAGLWTICWDHDVEAIVRAARSERLPRETGGVLVGAIDAQSHRIYVVDAILSPPDSVEWPSLYIRGAEGLDERVAAVGVSTAGMLQYVGEWHSHPDGCSAQASGTDQEALGRLSRQMAFEGLPALMLIVGQHDLQFFLASVV